MLNIRITNLPEFDRKNKVLVKRVNDALSDAVLDIVKHISSAAKASLLSGNKRGRLYFYGGRPHQASAAGQPPANISGNLYNKIISKKGGKLTAYSISQAKYSRYLEEGTRKMAARPFMKPAVEYNMAYIRNRPKQAIAEALYT